MKNTHLSSLNSNYELCIIFALFYYGDWIARPGVAVCSCNDGLRPVIFKLEATGEESEIDYTPVR